LSGMVERLPPDLEAKYNKYLKTRETLMVVLREKTAIEANLAEIDNVLRTLQDLSDDAEIFKAVGYIMVRTSKNDVVKELEQRKEDLQLRLTVLKQQEESLKKELERLESELKRMLEGAGVGGLGGAPRGGA